MESIVLSTHFRTVYEAVVNAVISWKLICNSTIYGTYYCTILIHSYSTHNYTAKVVDPMETFQKICSNDGRLINNVCLYY